MIETHLQGDQLQTKVVLTGQKQKLMNLIIYLMTLTVYNSLEYNYSPLGEYKYFVSPYLLLSRYVSCCYCNKTMKLSALELTFA